MAVATRNTVVRAPLVGTRYLLVGAVLSLIVATGCTMSETGQRVGTGAVGGAAIGALAGGLLGGGSGAAIGAGVGAVAGAGTGYLVDQNKKRQSAEARAAQAETENRRLKQQQGN
jgi:outer membrane lipoprotein SlyB